MNKSNVSLLKVSCKSSLTKKLSLLIKILRETLKPSALEKVSNLNLILICLVQINVKYEFNFFTHHNL